MTIQNVPGHISQWPQPYPWGSSSSYAFSASNSKTALIFQAPKTGNLDRVLVRVTAPSTASGNVLRVSIQTVNASGQPSGTLIAANAEAFLTDPIVGTSYEVAFTTPIALTKGDAAALVIEVSTLGSVAVTIPRIGHVSGMQNDFLPQVLNGTTSWVNNVNFSTSAIRMDGVWQQINNVLPLSSTSLVTIGVNQERANRFTLPFAARVVGMWCITPSAVPTSFQIYDLSNAIKAQVSFPTTSDVGLLASVPSNRVVSYLFPTPVDLPSGFEGRMSMRQLTTSAQSVRVIDVDSLAYVSAMPGGSNVVASSRGTDGSWFDFTNGARYAMGLLFGGFENQGAVASKRQARINGQWIDV